eukprot:TRINITY_DN25548_c0_g1_i1.p2 TRINITY_DN25548_c0_g1~~TRINITY_DN25548_c0_g1_i1.p2  ORF type:complete len:120 (-),score=28.82 TRINITY_DN25548_c0_g1_i1:24-383(-)
MVLSRFLAICLITTSFLSLNAIEDATTDTVEEGQTDNEEKLGREFLEEMIKEYDSDGDGEIALTEMLAHVNEEDDEADREKLIARLTHHFEKADVGSDGKLKIEEFDTLLTRITKDTDL